MIIFWKDPTMASLKEITDQYNTLAENAGMPTVARFASRKEAQRRLAALLKAYPEEEPGPPTDPETTVDAAPADDAPAEEEQVLGRAEPRLTRSQSAVNKLVAKLRAEGADVQVIVIKGVSMPVRRRHATRTRLKVPEGKLSLAQRAEELLLNGASNEELWEVFQNEYGLTDDKKSYPGWYRNSLKRQGKLPVDS
jgi:hypothetical protein